MIKVNNLTKKYNSKIAVDSLNFSVEKGKIYGLLGANGAGKSTTMNMITGYLTPTEGTILIDDIDISANPKQAKKKIGYLPEIPPLYIDMCVDEYIKFVAELKKIPINERKESVEKVINKTGLAEVSGRLIKHLSKGYRQRVGLAQALIGEPEIIILDEPTVGLDPVQIIEIRNLIESLKGDHTVILSSHILSEIENICDQIIIISKGKLVALDTPENMAKSLESNLSYTVKLKGEQQMIENLLSAIPSVNKVKMTDSDTAVVESRQDIAEKIFYACVEANIPILEMHKNRASLEDVFIELTTNNEEIEIKEA